MLKKKIQEDIIAFLKQGEKDKLGPLRSLLSEIQNAEINEKKELKDSDIIAMLRRQIKKLSAARDMFLQGGREDLAEENRFEMELLRSYLPAELSEQEIERRVKAILEKHKEVIEKGRLIGITVRELAGQVESGKIAKAVQKLLSEKNT